MSERGRPPVLLSTDAEFLFPKKERLLFPTETGFLLHTDIQFVVFWDENLGARGESLSVRDENWWKLKATAVEISRQRPARDREQMIPYIIHVIF